MNKQVLLVAEDDMVDALLLERALARTQSAFHMVRVVDGDETISYLEGRGPYADRVLHPLPHLLLLDLKMPRKDGFDVLEWRRSSERVKLLPVVVFSSSGLPDDIERAYALGANSYVTKPAGAHRLEGMVQALQDWWGGHNVTAPSVA